MPYVNHTPSLRRHKPSQQAIVTINGRDHYLGAWPSAHRKPPAEAQEAYDRLIAEWLANGRRLPVAQIAAVTVNELILAFWRRAELHYRRPDGTPTTELDDYRFTLKPLRELYGRTPAVDFSPLKLKAVRQKMIDADLCRGVINQRIGRIVRMFKWAVSDELIPETVHRALATVAGLERGRTDARESEPIQPVPDAFVEDTLPHVLPPVRAMIRLQRLTGMRPGEITMMRACDIDMSEEVWLYRPASHKTQHRSKARVVALGPKAQAIVKPFLTLDTQAYLFSPRRAIAELRAQQRRNRKTRVQPSQQNRRRRRPKKLPGERYTSRSYAQAIAKACEKADAYARQKAIETGMGAEEARSRVFVPHWHPNQLRHTHATEVRRRFGLEAAQVTLGHSQANVTQVYAERDLGLAVKVALEVG